MLEDAAAHRGSRPVSAAAVLCEALTGAALGAGEDVAGHLLRLLGETVPFPSRPKRSLPVGPDR